MICIYNDTCTHMHTNTPTNTQTYPHPHMYTHTNAHTHRHTHVRVCTCVCTVVFLEGPKLIRTEFGAMSPNGCTQKVTGSLSQSQPAKMTLQYFLHTTAQPASCTNELFKQFSTNVSAGKDNVVFHVNLIDSRLDTRQTVYLTSRFMMDGISSPCSMPIPLQITGLAHTTSLH